MPDDRQQQPHAQPHGPALIGCGAGFSGDRTDAAGPVVRTLIERQREETGSRAFLMFETLAERTLALAQLLKQEDANSGYEPLLGNILEPVLARCLDHGICIVGNFGAANPPAAAAFIRKLAAEVGAREPRIAVIHGDDLSDAKSRPLLARELGAELDELDVVSANAYLGAEAIALAIEQGADIVVCGRVADPSLALGPCIAHHRWAMDDWDLLAAGTMAGHLLECGAQVTGGYFADPGIKDVPDAHDIGFPIACISAGGVVSVSKARGTGGLVTLQTVKEQLLYEVHDPAAYLTPDVVADITQVTLEQAGPNEVVMRSVRGAPRPGSLKVNVFYEGGWLAEGEISYAGPRAQARAQLAADVLIKRLPGLQVRTDLIGVRSVFSSDSGAAAAPHEQSLSQDVRLRVAAACSSREGAQRLAREVTALYTCGPAGGGGVRTAVTRRLGNLSCLLPREAVKASHYFAE